MGEVYRSPTEHDQSPQQIQCETQGKYVIWILKNLKTVSTGIDSLGNKCVKHFIAIKYFVNMRKVPLEGDKG